MPDVGRNRAVSCIDCELCFGVLPCPDCVFWNQMSSKRSFFQSVIWKSGQACKIVQLTDTYQVQNWLHSAHDTKIRQRFLFSLQFSSFLSCHSKYHTGPQRFKFSFFSAEATYFTSKEKCCSHHRCCNLSFQFFGECPRKKLP